MVFNTTFNNISVISWWSVLLMEETGVPVASHWATLLHNVVLSTCMGFKLTTLVVIGTDCTGSWKSNDGPCSCLVRKYLLLEHIRVYLICYCTDVLSWGVTSYFSFKQNSQFVLHTSTYLMLFNSLSYKFFKSTY